MKLLDERGIGTVWSICKEKFALVGHTHNYAGSGSPGGSANSAIGVIDYNQTGKTIQIGYSGTGITGDQIKYIAGYTDGSGNVNAKIKDVSKDALKSWLGLGSLAYSSSSIPTKLSQLTNDKGFVTGSVSGNTVTINGASTTWTNTWRGIQDNLTSTSTSDSLSANQGKVLKGLIDIKANSSDLSSYTYKNQAISLVQFQFDDYGQQYLKTVYADEHKNGTAYMLNASSKTNGCMSKEDKVKLDGIASGANNYSLPVASDTTLGGIRTSLVSDNSYEDWPIIVDNTGTAYANIGGLSRNNIGNIGGISVTSDSYITNYADKSIEVVDISQNERTKFSFPSKAGTFALTSDIPNVSNLCKFNFVSSISECKSDRINFLLGFTGYDIDLSDFDNYQNGTILLISTTNDSVSIKHQSGRWYSAGQNMNMNDSSTMYIGKINLVTKNNGMVHHYQL